MASSSNATMETPEKRFFGSKSCTVLEKWPASGEDIIPVRNPYPTIPDPNEYNQTSSRGALKEQDESSSYTLAERIVYKMDNFPYKATHPAEYKKNVSQQFYRLCMNGLNVTTMNGRNKPEDVPETIGLVYKTYADLPPWSDYFKFDPKTMCITFSGGETTAAQSNLFQEIVGRANLETPNAKCGSAAERMLKPFRTLSDETIPVFRFDGQQVMNVPREAAEPFGLPIYSVALIANTNLGNESYWWIPQRGEMVEHSGKYDVSLSGILCSEDNPWDRIKELAERHHSITPEVAEDIIYYRGTISYHTLKRKANDLWFSEPRVQYVFEAEVDDDLQLHESGELENLQMCTEDQMWKVLAAGEFEPHAQMTMLSHLIRLGVVNSENEPNLHLIEPRLHRRLDVFNL